MYIIIECNTFLHQTVCLTYQKVYKDKEIKDIEF